MTFPNLNMNMYGSGWGNYSYGSTLPMLFNGVTNCLFNYGNYSSYSSGCSCCSSSTSANWGNIIGYTIMNCLPFFGTFVGNRVQQSQTTQSSNEQEFKNALKTLGFPESITPDKLTSSQIDSASANEQNLKDLATFNRKIEEAKDEKTYAEKAYDDAKKAVEQLSSLSSEQNHAKAELNNLETRYSNETDPDTRTEIQTQINSLRAAIEERKKEIEILEEKQKDITPPNGLLYKAKENANAKIEKAEADKKAAMGKLKEAAEVAKRYLEAYQAQLLDDADGNSLNRRHKKYTISQASDQCGCKLNDSEITDFTARDWRGLINDYRTGNDGQRAAIKEFIKSNKEYLPNDDPTIRSALDIICN